MRLFSWLLLTGLFSIVYSCSKEKDPVIKEFTVAEFDALPISKTNGMKIYAHYMPWFEDKSTSANGKWGWHWTMNNQNPDNIDAAGKREIAAHYYPIIGPYASSNSSLIEYHLLLMKYSGIDGVLIDWYGSSDVLDYGTNRRNTEALIDRIDEVGLKFAIVYEDATIGNIISQTGSGDALSLARSDMLYIKQKYFANANYIKIDGKPLLMVFGPNYFHEATQWDFIMSVFDVKPCFMPLWGNSFQTGTTTEGEYIWVDQTDIDTKYATSDQHNVFAGGAWPGFNDFYQEGGAGNTLFVIEHDQGSVWNELLEKASANEPDFLQLITWNDFGEGTMIEPTIEFGYTYLEKLQEFSGASYSKDQLEYIAKQYQFREELATDKTALKVLDQAFYYWVSLQNNKAEHLIDSLALVNQ